MIACDKVMTRIDLSFAPEPGYLPTGCCDSCHEDYEEFGYYMCEIEFDGELVEVCCVTSVAWDKHDSRSA